MDLQIRLAETGHYQQMILQPSSRGHNLTHLISQAFKINPKDQLLFSKIGHCIEPQQQLRKILTEQRVANQTIKDYKEGEKDKYDNISCIYVFNLKEMSKPLEQHQIKQKSHWLDELKQKIKATINIRPAIPSFQSLAQIYPSEVLQNYSNAVGLINGLKNSYQKLHNEYTELEEIHTQVNQIMERCQKQRKSIAPLNKLIVAYFSEIKTNFNSLGSNMKNHLYIGDKSLRENSGCFENKKRQEKFVSDHEKQIKQFKQQIQSTAIQIKNYSKETKKKFRGVDHKILEYSNRGIKKQIQEISKLNVQEYNRVIGYFRKLVDSQDDKWTIKIENAINIIEKTYDQKGSNQYEHFYQLLTDYYCEFSQFNQRNRFIVKQCYQSFIQWKEKFAGFQQQTKIYKANLAKVQNIVMKEQSFSERNSELDDRSYAICDSQKSLQSFKISIKTEAEVKRRVKFYTKLNYIQKLVETMCTQEESLRKKYISESRISKEKNKELLKNIKVPKVDFNFNDTTDFQIFKANRSAIKESTDNSLNPQQFMVIQYCKILDKINGLIGQDSNQKVKNLQEILKAVSDIFYKIYHKKYDQINNEKLALDDKVQQLQQICKSLQGETTNYKNHIETLNRAIVQKDESYLSLQKSKSDELTKERYRCERVIGDKKTLENNLKKQMKLTEELQTQVTISYQELQNIKIQNQQLKAFLKEKNDYILRLETFQSSKTNELLASEISVTNKEENSLKSVVQDNLSQKIREQDEHQRQISELKCQNVLLQNQNERLQLQIDQLQLQLRKIIMKETQDDETQTDVVEYQTSSKQSLISSIQIGEQIVIGQSYIFMPFSNSLYIGVYYKDQDRTLCNMSNSNNQPHYILNLESFNYKTRELLNQCSFLVVLKVQKIKKDSHNFNIEGKIEYLLGFEDDNLGIKNYASYLS